MKPGTPLRVSLVASSGVFVAALLAVLFHQNTFNGHTLTPMEQLPAALLIATLFSAMALLGTWLGLRNGPHVTYLAGLVGALIYLAATILANSLIHTAPRTVTIPSQEAAYESLKILVMGVVWGTGAPYLIALLTRRFKFVYRKKIP